MLGCFGLARATLARHQNRLVRAREEQVVHISVVPTVMHELLTSPDVKDEDLRTLRKPRTGGTVMPNAAKERFQERFGFKPATSFALTEGPNQVSRLSIFKGSRVYQTNGSNSHRLSIGFF